MKLDTKALANAFALITGIVYAVCAGLVAIAPDFFLSITNSWVHGLDLTKIQSVNITAGSFFGGFLSIVIFAWLAAYIFGAIYNSLVKRA